MIEIMNAFMIIFIVYLDWIKMQVNVKFCPLTCSLVKFIANMNLLILVWIFDIHQGWGKSPSKVSEFQNDFLRFCSFNIGQKVGYSKVTEMKPCSLMPLLCPCRLEFLSVPANKGWSSIMFLTTIIDVETDSDWKIFSSKDFSRHFYDKKLDIAIPMDTAFFYGNWKKFKRRIQSARRALGVK